MFLRSHIAVLLCWGTGDWNGDAEFDTSDLVFALREGGYEQGLRPAAAVVPEPTSIVLMGLGILLFAGRRSQRSRIPCTLKA